MKYELLKPLLKLLIIPVFVGIIVLFIQYNYFELKSGIPEDLLASKDSYSYLLGKVFFDKDKIIDNFYCATFDRIKKEYINGMDSIQKILEDFPGTSSQKRIENWDIEIYSSNTATPVLKLDFGVPRWIINEGDLDADGIEEFSIIFYHTQDSNIEDMPLYTLKGNRWQQIGVATYNRIDDHRYEDLIYKDKKCNCILLYNYYKYVSTDADESNNMDTIFLR